MKWKIGDKLIVKKEHENSLCLFKKSKEFIIYEFNPDRSLLVVKYSNDRLYTFYIWDALRFLKKYNRLLDGYALTNT